MFSSTEPPPTDHFYPPRPLSTSPCIFFSEGRVANLGDRTFWISVLTLPQVYRVTFGCVFPSVTFRSLTCKMKGEKMSILHIFKNISFLQMTSHRHKRGGHGASLDESGVGDSELCPCGPPPTRWRVMDGLLGTSKIGCRVVFVCTHVHGHIFRQSQRSPSMSPF